MKNYMLSISLSIFAIISCTNQSTNPQAIVQKWNNREVQIPVDLNFKSLGKDTVCPNILNHHYKVLVYVDSIGCISCKLNLYKWKDFMDGCHRNKFDLSFLFVVQSNNYDFFNQKIKAFNFSYPIIYDRFDKWNKLNKFPKDEIYHTFLLNEKNIVVLIGSPIDNVSLRTLYFKVLNNGKSAFAKTTSIKENNIKSIGKTSVSIKENNIKSIGKTSVMLKNKSVYFGEIPYDSIKHASFHLKNTTSQPLIIQTVYTSCGCTVARFSKKPIVKDEDATIILDYKPNSLGYFNKTADVLCNVPEGVLHLRISGVVVK